MKNLFYIAGLFLLLIIATAGHAQRSDNNLKLSLNYQYGFPLGGFKNDIVDQSSPRGMSGDIMYTINPHWSVGGGIGFQDYYQKYPRQVYDLDKNSQVSAVLTNSVQITPVLAKAMFMIGGSSTPVSPYISAGLGVSFVNFDQWLGEFATRESSVQFTAQGDAGVLVPVSRDRSTGIKIGAGYNYVPYKRFGYTGLDTWNLHAGVYFALH